MRQLCGTILAAFLAFTLGGCSDAFSFFGCRTIAQSFCLEQWEDGETYYLSGPIGQDRQNIIEGTVTSIGWNERYILVRRFANFRGDRDGWMVIDIDHKSMVGPLADDEIQKDARLHDITPRNPKNAWESLSYF